VRTSASRYSNQTSLGGSLGSAPLLFTLFLVLIIVIIETLHGVGDGLGLLGLGLIGNLSLFFVEIYLLLGLGVSVHEEIDDDVPILVTGDLTAELEDFAGHKPEAVGNGVATLIVGGDGDINPVEGRVGVGKSNHGDVHVGGLNQALVVETGVANDDETGLEELLGVVIGKGTGNPLSTEVLSTGSGGELEDGTLGVLSGGHNKDVFLVLGLGGSDNSGGNHELLPGLRDIKVVNTVLVTLVDVVAHLLGDVLGTDVDLGGDHVDEIVFSVLGVEEGHFYFRFL